MNLRSKKQLIGKTLNVGVNRILLDETMLSEIKEAITRQDIRDLKKQGIIKIKEIKGRQTKKKRKTRRKQGSRKKKIVNRKQEYVKITRKLRDYIKNLQDKNDISKEIYQDIRKKIRSRNFRSLAHLREYIKELKK